MRPGFTLLELLLVLAVLGVLSALAAARLGGMRGGQGILQAARMVQEQALRAQHLAEMRGRIARLRLDPEARTAAVGLMSGTQADDPGDGQPAALSLFDGADAFTVAFRRDDGSPVPSGPVDVLFLPDRRCDVPGRIDLSLGDRTATVRIAPGAVPPAIEAAP